MENVPTKSEINCLDVVSQLRKLNTLFSEYSVALSSPDIRDNLPAGIKRAQSVETAILELEALFPIEAERMESLKSFLVETWKEWKTVKPETIVQKASLVVPKSLNIEFLKRDIDKTKFGEYTLNPECLGLDFDDVKIKVLDIEKEIKDNNLRNLAQIFDYVIKTYSDKYIIPDLSFWQWMIQKAPAVFKDVDYSHFCFGSILRHSGGEAFVPSMVWNGSKCLRGAALLGGGWPSHSRVILLER
jgi:hypothetical protein